MKLLRIITSFFLIINFQIWSKDALDSKFQIDNNAVVPQIGYIEFEGTNYYACIDSKVLTDESERGSLPKLCKCIGFVQICIMDIFTEPNINSTKAGKLIKKISLLKYENFYIPSNQFTNDEIFSCLKDVPEKEKANKMTKCKEVIQFEEDIPLITNAMGSHWQCNGCHSYVDKKDGWVKLPKEPFKQEVWLDYKNSYFYQREKPLRGDVRVADGAVAIDTKTNSEIVLKNDQYGWARCVRILKVEGDYAYVTRHIVLYEGTNCSEGTRKELLPADCTSDKRVCDKSKAICSTLMKDYEILKIPTSAFLGKNGHVLGWCRDPENMY